MSEREKSLPDPTPNRTEDIAIVGLAAHVPGAPDAGTFWRNLRDGVGSIRVLDEAALLAAGERPDIIAKPNYVAAAAPMDGYDLFDAEFFGFSPKEAAILDPQHRKFLEVSWNALENAGHLPDTFDGKIGVYAGCGMGSYFYFNICSNPEMVRDVGMFLLRHTGNDKDFLTTRVSHVFDLKGPSVNLQTACSTSLVAVHYAARALRDGDCDMALAGGVTIELPQGRGYLYKENEVLSPDGQCHAFDHRAQGTVFGSGAGAVVLRRLSDALTDGDHIYAVIRGSAVNNDGADKAGYLAPSVGGQAAAIRDALDAAGVSAESIDYVECHGTGTYLGDPIEVSALTHAYKQDTAEKGFCGIGSVKTNIGHLDTAAGVAGLIKTAMALEHKQIPPSLGYDTPNPAIEFDNSPFHVNHRLTEWRSENGPRRAGVNALGVGGTNAHAILEEAPDRPASEDSDWPFHVLSVSGRTSAALDANSQALSTHLNANPQQSLADVAFTLKNGRRAFDKRRVVVAATHDEAAELLASNDPHRVFTHICLGDAPDVVFMFPGGGAQYPNMARDLYETEPVFAEWMDRGLGHLQSQLDYDIRSIWLAGDDAENAAQRLQKPSVQLPLIMIVEYALAQLWLSWGIRPAALIGHSMGENTAACLAGVFSFEAGIDLVLLRGRLFDTVPKGGMLSVSLPKDELEKLIGPDLDIASVNAPGLCAVSGPQDALDLLSTELTGSNIDHQRVQIDIAAHSRMLDDILPAFREFLNNLDLKTPGIPFISNRTGELITDTQATDPEYWVGQLRNTVHFSKGIETLSARADRVFLEVGPGRALSSLAQMSERVSPNQVIPSLRHPDQQVADDMWFLTVIGRLWACGVEADWDQVWGEARRHRVPLPGYAFQRSRYFIEPGTAAKEDLAPLMRQDDMSDWGYSPVWRPAYADCDIDPRNDTVQLPDRHWLIFMDDVGVLEPVIDWLRGAGQTVSTVRAGDSFAISGKADYILAPEDGRAGYDALLEALAQSGPLPDRIVHGWLITGEEKFRPGSNFFDRNVQHGFYSLLHLVQAMADAGMETGHLTAVTTGAAQIGDSQLRYPEKTLIAGPAGVVPREFPGLTVSTIDVPEPQPKPSSRWGKRKDHQENPTELTNVLIEEVLADPSNRCAAYAGGRRYQQRFAPTPLPASQTPVYRDGRTYLITGGLGGIGLTLAEDLLSNHKANVVLLGRHALPPREEWEQFLDTSNPENSIARRVQALLKLEKAGGQVHAMAADVTDIDQMREVVAHVSDRFGAITGVLHAAGHIDDAPILTKDTAQIEAVLAPKLHGLRVLDTIFPDGDLELLVLFSSSSVATRPAGQVDYVAANAFLNASALSRQNGKTQVLAINWGVWSEVGMAADAMARRTGTVPDPVNTDAIGPLLQRQGVDHSGDLQFQLDLPASHWLFDEHRTSQGKALMPGTGYIEMAAEAAANLDLPMPFEIRDLYFIRPIDAQAADRQISISVKKDATGQAIEFRSDAALGARQGTQLNAQAVLAPSAQGANSGYIDPPAIAKRCAATETASHDGSLRAPQEVHLDFGPRWRSLKSIALGQTEGLAHLSLPTQALDDLGQCFVLHPALMDIATGWAMQLIPGYTAAHLWVPLSYENVRVHRPLPANIFSWVRIAQSDLTDGRAEFDVTLCDENGGILVEVTGFVVQKIEASDKFGSAAPLTEAEILFDPDDGSAVVPLSPDEERLLHNITQGIRPDEGPEALRRALSANRSAMVVSSLPLPALIEDAHRPAAEPSVSEAAFARPELDSSFLAPRNAIEQTLADHWQKLLGIEQVGVEDSFFDLGGHSLIAVRLFAMIKREFGADFAISLLFETPTIARIAERIAESTGRSLDAPEEVPADDTPHQTKPDYTHLITLQKASSGTPLFVVAGMFGNVLNLRQLALQIGQDRPVYGLQARGLIGSEDPHGTIPEAARAYAEEIRQVQPHGPYLLSGFSGGGITAYEIAQQLEAAGEEVTLLALLDTPLPVRPELTRRDKALIKIQEIRRKGPRYLGEWALNRIAWEISKRETNAPEHDASTFNNDKIEHAFRRAVAQYELQNWTGNLVLFRPPLDRHWKVSDGQWVSSEREYVFEDNDWTRFAPHTRVIEVPGDHDSMVLSPNVRVLAARLSHEIAAAERQQNPMLSTITAAE